MRTVTAGMAALKAGAAAIWLCAAPVYAAGQEPGPSPADEAGASDADTVRLIENQLDDAQGLEGADITVTTDGGMMALRGEVPNILAHDRAIRIATSVQGVRAVDDNLTVKAVDRPDRDIERDVETALALDPATEFWEIDALVRDGNVTLRGIVESYAEQSLAGKVAKSVRGVRSITNSIEVDYGVPRKDREIAREVRQVLKLNTTVDSDAIDVEVADGTVTLSGEVGSLYGKDQAVRLSRVAGVEKVEAADLAISPDAATQAKSRWADPGDEETAAAVRVTLALDPRVDPFEPRVAVDDGVVTLSGVVDNQMAKRAAAETARNTLGVEKVRNHLTVEPEPAVPDEKLEEQVAGALARDPYVTGADVEVDVVDGDVYLYGAIDSWFEKREAGDAASRVSGVREVHNELDVPVAMR